MRWFICGGIFLLVSLANVVLVTVGRDDDRLMRATILGAAGWIIVAAVCLFALLAPTRRAPGVRCRLL